jgi:hypothetical protein
MAFGVQKPEFIFVSVYSHREVVGVVNKYFYFCICD